MRNEISLFVAIYTDELIGCFERPVMIARKRTNRFLEPSFEEKSATDDDDDSNFYFAHK